MPPCSLISSMRSIIPRRTCLPKPAIGPERSWIEPITISSLLTPCVCATAAPLANAAAAMREAANFMGGSPGWSSAVHRIDALGVLLLDELALELHRRRQLVVFRGQQRLEQEELLDLLDAGELPVDALDLV